MFTLGVGVASWVQRRISTRTWGWLPAAVLFAWIGLSPVVGAGTASAAPSTESSQSDAPAAETTKADDADTADQAANDDPADVAPADDLDEAADDDLADEDLGHDLDDAPADPDEADADVELVATVEPEHEPEPEADVRRSTRETRDAEPMSIEADDVDVQPSVVAEPEASPPVDPEPAPEPEPEPAPAPAPEPARASATVLSAPRTPVAARPVVTVDQMVGDVLTWVGLGPLADGLPLPAAPVSAFVQSLWLAVRQAQYTLNNQRPVADATVSGPGPDGTVTGSLNAVDYDDTLLTYVVTAAPMHGTVVVDAAGNFAYTPDSTGTADRFTVTVDDRAGNPFHVHGLRGLLGLTRPTAVVVAIDAAAARRSAVPDAAERRIRVIDGHITDQTVVNAEDAAAVLNAWAPALGAATGFADPSDITVEQAGVGAAAERFYRYTETVGGITVLGSDVILVTDAAGTVTSVFNNYVGVGDAFDVTPDAALDENDEVWLLASAAYLGAAADADVLDEFRRQNSFTSTLVVYALDATVDPSLAWRVLVQLPDTGDMSPAGATYVIDADGSDAGTVIVSVSNLTDSSVSSAATDRRGDSRDITVMSGGVFFPRYTMVDADRNLTTYKTSYNLFGFGTPILPGSVVKRGWFGWNTSAVSAHANTALVHDYYLTVLGRESFDGDGAPITVSIRYNPVSAYRSSGYANAFWDPSRQQFAYGDKGYLEAAVDVVGHEFTHAVISYVVGTGGSVLDHGESGALNEAYADVLGVLIEGKTGADRWLLGEDSGYGVVRNIADPTSIRTSLGPHRDHYSTRYTGKADDGGEHVNSTIFSHAAYLMMTDPATAGIADDTWARVFYHSLFRLTSGAVFADGRAAVLSSASASGFTAAQLDAIRRAFDDVGISDAATSSLLVA